MTPFAIAGVQMYVNALQPNVDGMIHRLDLLMARFPWTQMVLFSELAPFGPLPKFSLPLRDEAKDRFCAAARLSVCTGRVRAHPASGCRPVRRRPARIACQMKKRNKHRICRLALSRARMGKHCR